jgi:hypothetical protein
MIELGLVHAFLLGLIIGMFIILIAYLLMRL